MVRRSQRRVHGPRTFAAGTTDIGNEAHCPYATPRTSGTIEFPDPEDSMTTNLTVTTALPPRGRNDAVLRVAAQYDPSVLRIVAGVPAPDFRRPFALHRFVHRRARALARLADAAAVARTIVGPDTHIETALVRGRLSDYLATGADGANVLVVGGAAHRGELTHERMMHDGRLMVSVGDQEPGPVHARHHGADASILKV